MSYLAVITGQTLHTNWSQWIVSITLSDRYSFSILRMRPLRPSKPKWINQGHVAHKLGFESVSHYPHLKKHRDCHPVLSVPLTDRMALIRCFYLKAKAPSSVKWGWYCLSCRVAQRIRVDTCQMPNQWTVATVIDLYWFSFQPLV